MINNVIPIPARESIFEEPAGRPGDWWEPFPFSAGEIAAEVRQEAVSRQLPIDLVVALLVERAQVVSDIAVCGIDLDAASLAVSREADGAFSTGPGRLHTSYVRMLRRGVSSLARESGRQLTRRDLVLPLRLHAAARAMELDDLGQRAAVEEAIRWEIAAASNAQFMREWSLRLLLADSASTSSR